MCVGGQRGEVGEEQVRRRPVTSDTAALGRGKLRVRRWLGEAREEAAHGGNALKEGGSDGDGKEDLPARSSSAAALRREHLLPLRPEPRRHRHHRRGQQPHQHCLRRLLTRPRRRRRRGVHLALPHFSLPQKLLDSSSLPLFFFLFSFFFGSLAFFCGVFSGWFASVLSEVRWGPRILNVRATRVD